ncbi:hypothetical protein B0H94_10398 [Salsuginibacillus halophilus]|uniref:ABC transporter periplasmic binding protein YphF n=1 Tax=Salsuginibacillus halophilus TaxID=517424 RepID=A0A2P8HW90_9BACI|nr:hypothetical protein [Salsuginibacillus halophilus]PSL50486.1 hypothetical protein B0H94_10398 [Salsuginibacillus halophilus]
MQFMYKAAFAFVILILTAGCFYPGSSESSVPHDTQLEEVQAAVDQYQDDQGVLPLQNRDADTPELERYVVNFRELVPRYLAEPPPNSFEEGGIYQYMLIDVQENPEVKVMDLSMMDDIQSFQQEVNRYIQANDFAPLEDALGENVYAVDEDSLSVSEASVESPYSGNPLPLRVNQHGEVIVDYAPDIYQKLEHEEVSVDDYDDLREILLENEPFIPMFSVPYELDEGELAYSSYEPESVEGPDLDETSQP